MGCVANCRVDDLRMERCVSVRDMRIESNPRAAAVTSVDLASVLAAPAGAKILSVGRGSCPSATELLNPLNRHLQLKKVRF
jgi:hypothetical protein